MSIKEKQNRQEKKQILSRPIDDLLFQLEDAGIGCYWNHHYVGAICYADDISYYLHHHRLHFATCFTCTCSIFAESHNLVSNASKTQLIKFSRYLSRGAAKFDFHGQDLTSCESVSHLGHILSSDLSDDADISSIKKEMCRKANYMLHTFAPCDPFTKSQLLHSFCLSLYGSALWLCSSSELKSLEISFNNIIRKIWSLRRDLSYDIIKRDFNSSAMSYCAAASHCCNSQCV